MSLRRPRMTNEDGWRTSTTDFSRGPILIAIGLVLMAAGDLVFDQWASYFVGLVVLIAGILNAI